MMTACPKCGNNNDSLSIECSKCGIIFARYYEIQARDETDKYKKEGFLVLLKEEEEKTEILASSQFRRGGQPYNEDEADEDEEDLSEDYAILLDQTNDWDSGFALLVVMRRVDAVNRYVLVPVGVGGGGGDTAVFKVSAGIGETTITLGDAGDVTAYEYRGDLCVRSNGQWTSTADSVCYDLSFNAENHPANRDAYIAQVHHSGQQSHSGCRKRN